MAYRNYGPEVGFIVDKNGHGDFTTIASALTAATSGVTIFINPGTYTENLTLKAGVNLAAFECDASTPNVTISGTCTFTVAGTCSISGIRLQTNSAPFLTVSGSAASRVYLLECFLIASNNTGISFTSSSSSALIECHKCFGDIGTTGIAIYSMSSAGTLNIFYGNWTNSGGSTTASSNSAGTVLISQQVNIRSPLSTSSTGVLRINNCMLETSAQNATCVTTAGTGSATLELCALYSGTASAISVGAGTTVNLATANISSSNANVLTGAGTLNYGGIIFTGSSSGHNVTTETPFATLN